MAEESELIAMYVSGSAPVKGKGRLLVVGVSILLQVIVVVTALISSASGGMA